jgi:beta-aspartyl-peptidase (threonine type)
VLLAGEGAARFAASRGFAPVEEATMITDLARQRWEAARRANAPQGWAGGTVGAVARDARGHVAAATSTGGMMNKLAGRVGDSPLIGAGTYADDAAGACSTTGHGEAMMRICAAKRAVDGLAPTRPTEGLAHTPEGSARATLAVMHARTGERGGLILVGADGTLGLARTTRTMTWASIADGPDAPRASGS